jgi:hypothetical protein
MKRPDSVRGSLAVLASFMPRALRAAWAGGIALAIGLAATAAWTLSTTRLYRSEAIVLFEPGQTAAVGESPRAVAGRLNDMVMSRQRLETLINEKKLYRKLRDKKGMGEAVDEMRKRLTFQSREGFSYRVSYDGESRDLAKDVLDSLTKSVLEEDNKRRKQDAEETKHFLDAERKQADQDLKDKESTLATFLTKHPQLASETGGGATAGGLIRAADRDRATAGLGGGEIAALEMQAAQLEEQLAPAARPRIGGKLVDPAADPQLTAAVTRTQADLSAIQKDLAEKQLHLTNEHPDVKNALHRLATAEAAAKRAEAALAAWRPTPQAAVDRSAPPGPDAGDSTRTAALRRALSAVRQQIAAVRGRGAPRAEVPKTSGSLVAIDTEWTRLNRDVSEAKERQNQLEMKQFQAQLAATLILGGLGGQLLVADPPFRPMRPVAGQRMKIAMFGAAASFMLALLVIGLFAAFDDRLYAARDIESFVEDGIIVVIPKVTLGLIAPPKGG